MNGRERDNSALATRSEPAPTREPPPAARETRTRTLFTRPLQETGARALTGETRPEALTTSAEELRQRRRKQLLGHAESRLRVINRLTRGLSRALIDLSAAAQALASSDKRNPSGRPASSELFQRLSETTRHVRSWGELLDAASHPHLGAETPIDLHAEIKNLQPMLRTLTAPRNRLEIACDASHPTITADPTLFRLTLLSCVIASTDSLKKNDVLWIHTQDLPPQADGRRRVTIALRNTPPHKTPFFQPATTDNPASPVSQKSEDTLRWLGTLWEEIHGEIEHPLQLDDPLWLCFSLSQRMRFQGTTRRDHTAERSTRDETSPTSVHKDPEEPGSTTTPLAAALPQSKVPPIVLVVDDEPLLRRMTARVLKRHGFTTQEASGGTEALKIARSLQAPIDLLITDQSMPGMEGGELAQRLLNEHPNLAVLLVSGYPGDSALTLREAGAPARSLTKPYQTKALIDTTKALLKEAQDAKKARQRSLKEG